MANKIIGSIPQKQMPIGPNLRKKKKDFTTLQWNPERMVFLFAIFFFFKKSFCHLCPL
jgi:hypothetical protein